MCTRVEKFAFGRASRVEGRVAAMVDSNAATSDNDDMGEIDGLAPGEFE